jgi:hypothetical protein
MAIDFVADPDNLIQVWHGTDPARFSAGKTLNEAVDDAIMKTSPLEWKSWVGKS